MTQRLKTFYLKEIVPKLMNEFQYKNNHQVPQVKKVVINRGLGEASQNAKTLDASLKEISITYYILLNHTSSTSSSILLTSSTRLPHVFHTSSTRLPRFTW